MDDAAFMRRAMELAVRGRGRVEPNPMVGCVLVRDGKIIGEGAHEYFGGPHAEPNALATCSNPAGATAFVSLEPCCAYPGKKTPACASALIAARISRVVSACRDPNPAVSGKGLQQLRDAGIAVEENLLADEAQQLNAAFFKQTQFARPYVTLKWAQTADGKIAGPGGQRIFISNSTSLRAIHQFRSRCDAIVVGIGTVLADDPMLTPRVPNPPRIPVRVVLDSNLRIGLDRQLIGTAAEAPVLICCTSAIHAQCEEKIARLHVLGVEVIALPDDGHRQLSLNALLDELGRRAMTHIFVEPGPRLASSFLTENLADRVWITRSPKVVEVENAPCAPKIDYPATGRIQLDGDELTEYLNSKSSVFFCLQPSADFKLAQE
jgi:diaminohydroxyphosphoribosylaminopyrimidine deaminase / 5-amino-6-(5-phosphoribosylamino)uracil reductase